MNCPHCSRPMEPGHITGTSVIRIIPDSEAPKKNTSPLPPETIEEFRAARLPGYLLDIEYSGMAAWIKAEYCIHCKKAVCVLDLIDTEGVEEA